MLSKEFVQQPYHSLQYYYCFPVSDPGKQPLFLLSAQPEHCHRKNRLQLLHHFRWKISQTPHPHSLLP